MITTLNPPFDHRAGQHGSVTIATTLNPPFSYRANQSGSVTDMPATLNPAIPTSLRQLVEHVIPAVDRAA